MDGAAPLTTVVVWLSSCSLGMVRAVTKLLFQPGSNRVNLALPRFRKLRRAKSVTNLAEMSRQWKNSTRNVSFTWLTKERADDVVQWADDHFPAPRQEFEHHFFESTAAQGPDERRGDNS